MSAHFAARLVVSVSAEDVGRRVSLRSRLPDGRFSDVVGVLESWGEKVLTVRRRNGELVELPRDRIVAGKVVPAAPPRRR